MLTKPIDYITVVNVDKEVRRLRDVQLPDGYLDIPPWDGTPATEIGLRAPVFQRKWRTPWMYRMEVAEAKFGRPLPGVGEGESGRVGEPLPAVDFDEELEAAAEVASAELRTEDAEEAAEAPTEPEVESAAPFDGAQDEGEAEPEVEAEPEAEAEPEEPKKAAKAGANKKGK